MRFEYAVRQKLQHLRSNHKRHCCLHQEVPDNTNFCLYYVTKRKSFCEVENENGWTEWICVGSSHGLLILVDNYYDSSKVTLFKPFSGKDIDLPLIKRKMLLQYSGMVCKQILSFKAVLFINPDLSMNEFVLMMSYCDCMINESNIHQIRKKKLDLY